MLFYFDFDLCYTYKWFTRQDDPMLMGEPGAFVFDPLEGWQVLRMINWFAQRHPDAGKSLGQKIEVLLRHHLPGSIHSQSEVLDWLEKNWSRDLLGIPGNNERNTA
jgi:hypothetical protein